MAAISSSTAEPGSFRPSSFSAIPQSHTERAMPAIVPAAKTHRLWARNNRANHNRPTNEPKVPGPQGIRPAPKPWAIQSATLRSFPRADCPGSSNDPLKKCRVNERVSSTARIKINSPISTVHSQILEVKGAVFPEIEPAGNKRQDHGQPFRNLGKPNHPGHVTNGLPIEDHASHGPPFLVTVQHENGNDSDDL